MILLPFSVDLERAKGLELSSLAMLDRTVVWQLSLCQVLWLQEP